MRKLFFILTVLISFALGLASQNLFAGGGDPNYEYPAEGSRVPYIKIDPYFYDNGLVRFWVPDGYKLVNAALGSEGNVLAFFKKKKSI